MRFPSTWPFRRTTWLAFVPLFLMEPLAAAEPGAVEFGILPTLSTRTILETYQPLREYLEQRLGRPVSLVTAPDYRTYIERTQRGEYRFLVTAPHFARLAQNEAGYVPMVRVQRELRGLIVVREDSGIRQLAELRGKVVTSPEPLAIVTMLGRQLLRQAGLEPGKDLNLRAAGSFNSAVLAVHHGEAAAAITAATALTQMPEEVRTSLRTIGTSPPMPHVIYIAHRRVPKREREEMTRVLLEFSADSQHGAPFFQKTGFGGLVQPTADELRRLDPYVTELRRQLKEP